MYYSKIKKKNSDSLQSSQHLFGSKSTPFDGITLSNFKKPDYNLTPTFDLPFILTQSINETGKSISKLNLSGSLYNDGCCFVIFEKVLFIWSIDKPEYCDRIELLDNVKRNHIVIYKNKVSNDRFSVFICSPITGYIRYWGNSSRPNVSQDLPLDSPSGNNFNIYIAECYPGVVVGNSLGSVYLVSVKNNNQLTSKKINKPQGMFSYLYLSRQLPVVSVASVNNLYSYQQQSQKSQQSSFSNNNNNSNNSSKYVYVLTEGSLLKYEVSNGTEAVVLDYLIHKEIQKQFQDTPSIRFHQMYIETVQDQNKDQVEIVNIILYETSASHNHVNYYLFQVEIQNEQILKAKRVDNFISNKQISGSGLKPTEPNFSTDSLKYFLVWNDCIFYYLRNQFTPNSITSGLIKFQSQDIAFSGFYRHQFYFFSEKGIIKVDLYNSNQIQTLLPQSGSSPQMLVSMDTDSSSSTIPSTILFDIPQNEEMIFAKRNNVLKWMNSISLKQFDKADQIFKQFKSYQDFNQIIQQVSIFIVDQQPSSRFWADDGTKILCSLGSDISIQLKQQLEDKKKRYAFFLKCISENSLERNLNNETKESLRKNEIMLNLAIELRDYQNHHISKPSILPQLIQDLVVELNPNWNNIGMNIYEIFYSNVSGIDQILISIISKLQEPLPKAPSSNPQQPTAVTKASNLLEGSELFYKSIQVIPVEFLNVPIISHPNQITTQSLMFQLISILVSFIQTELKQSSATLILYKKDLGNSDNIDDLLYQLLFNITEKYLYSLKINQTDQFNKLKTRIIEPFIQFGKFKEAIKLANQFDDYQSYIDVYIADVNNRDTQVKQIEDCLKKFESINPSSLAKIYQYMLDKELKSEILQLPSEFNDSLALFFQQYSDLSWIHSIRMKNYTKTLEILYSKANQLQLLPPPSQQDSSNPLFENSLKEKKNYLSTAKIALLASATSSVLQPTQQHQLNIINQNLALIKTQKYFFPYDKQVLSASDVISKILKKINEENSLDLYSTCIEIITESNLLLKKSDSDHFLLVILKMCLDKERVFLEIKPTSDIELDYSIRDTDFFKVVTNPHLPKELVQANLHPLIENYFNSQLNQFANDPEKKRDFEICIRRLLELSEKEISN